MKKAVSINSRGYVWYVIFRKTLACFLSVLGVIVCCLPFTDFTVFAREAPDPSSAAEEMLGAIAAWRQGDELEDLSGADNARAKAYLDVFGASVELLARRMSYKVYAHKITDNTAIVDVSVSAATLGDVAGPLLMQSAAYLAFQRFIGRPADLNAYISERLDHLIEEQPAVTTNVSMHLILGGDMRWKLDLSNEKNLLFLDALCGGGILPYIDAVKALLEQVPDGE